MRAPLKSPCGIWGAPEMEQKAVYRSPCLSRCVLTSSAWAPASAQARARPLQQTAPLWPGQVVRLRFQRDPALQQGVRAMLWWGRWSQSPSATAQIPCERVLRQRGRGQSIGGKQVLVVLGPERTAWGVEARPQRPSSMKIYSQ